MKKPVDTQDELCVGGISLSLQCSNEDIDETQPQGQERHGLVMGPPILLIELSLQQNLKHNINMANLFFTVNFFWHCKGCKKCFNKDFA